MNLRENIHRIQSLLTEDRDEMMKNLIDKHGLYYTINLMGGYDSVKRMNTPLKLTKWQKIEFIKDMVIKISEKFGINGFGVADTYESPIFVGDNDEVISQIEYFNIDSVYVDIYYKDTDAHKGDMMIKYENLDESVLDDVFEFMLNVG